MSIRQKIINELLHECSDIYCHNCANEETDLCDECDRKSMNWLMSESCAIYLADKILYEILGVNNGR